MLPTHVFRKLINTKLTEQMYQCLTLRKVYLQRLRKLFTENASLCNNRERKKTYFNLNIFCGTFHDNL